MTVGELIISICETEKGTRSCLLFYGRAGGTRPCLSGQTTREARVGVSVCVSWARQRRRAEWEQMSWERFTTEDGEDGDDYDMIEVWSGYESRFRNRSRMALNPVASLVGRSPFSYRSGPRQDGVSGIPARVAAAWRACRPYPERATSITVPLWTACRFRSFGLHLSLSTPLIPSHLWLHTTLYGTCPARKPKKVLCIHRNTS